MVSRRHETLIECLENEVISYDLLRVVPANDNYGVTGDLSRGNKLLNACHLFRANIAIVAGSEQSEARIGQT